MNTNDIKHLAVERIYLVPDASEGQLGYVWCDDPAPGVDMDPSEAVEYVRKDVHDAVIAKQAQAATQGMNAAKSAAQAMRDEACRTFAQCSPEALESEREANALLTERVAVLEADVERLRSALNYSSEYLYGSHLNTIGHGSKAHLEMVSALEDTPATSLARRDNCDLECGAYGTYCKCKAEGHQ